MLVADSPIIHIGSSDMFKQSMDASLAAAEDILSNWQSRTVPEELKALVALKDEKGAFGKFPKLLPLALKRVVRDRHVTVEQMQQMLQVTASGTARFDADANALLVDMALSRSLADGAAKARITLRPIEGDKSFFKKTVSMSANDRGDTTLPVPLRAGP